MKNTFWLVPGRVAGRCGPNHEPWSLSQIRAAGIAAVLNLSECQPCQVEFTAAQVDVAWIPLPNSYPADAYAEEECLRLLPQAQAFLQSHLDAGCNVLVHCTLGQDRTGLLLAYHLAVSEGLCPEEAIRKVKQVRPKALSARGWTEMAQRILLTLTAPQ